jgi:hypothetical protein
VGARTGAKVESRIQQLSRGWQDAHNSYELDYLPYGEQVLAHLGECTLLIRMDGSEVGRGCMTLMVSLIDQRRAIPPIWMVVARPKGHLSAQEHIALLGACGHGCRRALT